MTVAAHPLSCLDHRPGRKPRTARPQAGDKAAARRTLRDQIARLDGGGAALGETRPPPRAAGAGAPLQSLEALELQRDTLAGGAAARRKELDAQGERGELAR